MDALTEEDTEHGECPTGVDVIALTSKALAMPIGELLPKARARMEARRVVQAELFE